MFPVQFHHHLSTLSTAIRSDLIRNRKKNQWSFFGCSRCPPPPLSRPCGTEGNANPAGCSNYQPPRQRSCPIVTQATWTGHTPPVGCTRFHSAGIDAAQMPQGTHLGAVGVRWGGLKRFHLRSPTSPSEARSRASKARRGLISTRLKHQSRATRLWTFCQIIIRQSNKRSPSGCHESVINQS